MQHRDVWRLLRERLQHVEGGHPVLGHLQRGQLRYVLRDDLDDLLQHGGPVQARVDRLAEEGGVRVELLEVEGVGGGLEALAHGLLDLVHGLVRGGERRRRGGRGGDGEAEPVREGHVLVQGAEGGGGGAVLDVEDDVRAGLLVADGGEGGRAGGGEGGQQLLLLVLAAVVDL